jgi:O-antigen/teichoic acid export membrane protein
LKPCLPGPDDDWTTAFRPQSPSDLAFAYHWQTRAGPQREHVAIPSIRRELRRPLFQNASALILNIGLNGLIGMLYWVVAARRYSVEVIGRDTALIAAMQTLSTFAQLDLASLLLKFLPTWRDNAIRAVGTAYAVAVSVSLVISAGFAEIGSRVSSHWAFLGPVGVAAPLCCGAALWSVFAIEDGALTGLRRATLIPIENSAYGLAKLLLLVTLASALPNSGVFYSWLLPLVPVVLTVNWFLFRRALRDHRAKPLGANVVVLPRRQVIRYAGFDYVGALCGTVLTVGMPLIVSGIVGVKEAAVFYFPWTLILLLDATGNSLGASLVVEGTTDPSLLLRHARSILRLSTLLLLPAVVVIFVSAPLILDIFGHAYARGGTTTLRILILASLPRATSSVYTSVARVQLKMGQILGRVGGSTVVILALVVVLGREHGIQGIAVGWLVGSVLEFLVIVGPLWKALRRHHQTTT